MRISASVGALILLLTTTLAVTPVRADYFYNWGPSLPVVYSDNSGMHVVLSDELQSGPVSGQQQMTATVLSTFINQGVTGTDTFSQGQTVAIGLDLTDGTQAGHTTFNIGISGSLTAGSPPLSALSYTFLDGTTRSLVVNGTDYTISLDGPGTIPGSILATITPGAVPVTSDAPGGGTTNNAPEPSTLLLSTLALAILGLACWRRFGRAVCLVLA